MNQLFDSANLIPLVPEIFLGIVVLVLLLYGVFGGNRTTGFLTCGVIFALVVAGVIIGYEPVTAAVFHGQFITNPFIAMAKVLIVLGAVLVLMMSSEWLHDSERGVFEFPLLVLLSVIGMMVMVSAGSLLTIYMGLELMSLPLYVLAAMQKDHVRSTEAGLKYFVLGSLASGMMLFGMSFIYGFAGTLDLQTLAASFHQMQELTPYGEKMQVSAGIILGMILMIVGFAFKVSAVPFHMWTPDVYEGAPTPVTAFFAVAPKIAGLVIFARVLNETFGGLWGFWQEVVIALSVASMLVGALGAIRQQNIKRLLAYSSIGHVGYALVGLATGSAEGVSAVMIYLGLYIFMSVGAFACVLLMRRKGEYVEQIVELSGLAQTRPLMAAALAIFMFSMAGIPPFAGFFGKFYVFLAAVNSELYWLAVTGVVLSVISAYYYIRVVKVMYFDESRTPFDKEMKGGMRLVMILSTVVTLCFFLYPTPFVAYAKAAVKALAL